MSTTVTIIQFLLNDILSFHAELEKIFVMGKGIHEVICFLKRQVQKCPI